MKIKNPDSGVSLICIRSIDSLFFDTMKPAVKWFM